jgi:hypothetical protein
MADDDTRPSTPRAKLTTATRLQVRELVRTWLEMAPRRRHVRVEHEDGVTWAWVRDERGHAQREPLSDGDDPWTAWGRAMGRLPPREERL